MSDQEEKDKKLLDYKYEPLEQDISLARLHRPHSSSEVETAEVEDEPDAQSELLEANSLAQQPLLEARSEWRLCKGKNVADSTPNQGEEPRRKLVCRSRAGKWIFYLAIVPLLCLFATFSGMVVGFVVLGKGSLAGALHLHTWTHLLELVFAL